MIDAHRTDILLQRTVTVFSKKQIWTNEKDSFSTALLKSPALNCCKSLSGPHAWGPRDCSPGVFRRKPQNPESLTECWRTKNSHHGSLVVIVPFLDWTLDGGLPAIIFVSCLNGQHFWLFDLSRKRAGGQPWVFPEKTAHLHRRSQLVREASYKQLLGSWQPS